MEYDLYQHTILICVRQNNIRSTLNLETNFALNLKTNFDRLGETTYRANGKKLIDQRLNNWG